MIALSFGFFLNNPTNKDQPVNAAETSTYSSCSGSPDEGGTAYFRCYIYYDTSFGSLSSFSPQFTVRKYSSFVYIDYTATFTFTPKSGYSWGATSFIMPCDDDRDDSYSTALTGAYRYVTRENPRTTTVTRSGNTFSYSSGSNSLFPNSNSLRYGVDILYLSFRLNGSIIYPNFYTLTLNYTSSSTKYSVKYGSTLPSISKPSRTGYAFGGYYSNSNGSGTQYYDANASVTNTSWTCSGNKTIYAKWTPLTYNITLDNQGGTGGTSTITATYDGNMPSATMPTRRGYTFGGYYSETDGGGTQYYTDSGSSARTWNSTSITILYAKWISHTYNITLDGNGASNTMSPMTIQYGMNTTITSSYTLEGFSFAGWGTLATDREPSYANGFNFDTSSLAGVNDCQKDLTIYAIWKSTINLDQQGGSGGSTSITNTRNLSLNTATAPSRTGFVFGGYYTGTYGTGTQYYDANMASTHNNDLSQGRTLYACWYSTINLDQQTGTSGSTSVTGIYGSSMPSANAPVKAGYTFGGYWTAPQGKGTQYYNNTMGSAHLFDIPQGTSLFALWICGTVILDAQGGMDGSANVVPIWQADMPTATAPTKSGWKFDGYYTQTGGKGTQYYTANMTSSKVWEEATNVTLYAKWIATITLNMDGGANGTASVVVTYNAPMPSGAIAPTKKGYAFSGYYTESNGNGTRFYNDEMQSVQDWNLNVVTFLYAKWTPNVYVVTFEYNGATTDNSVATKNVTYGNFYSDLPIPSKPGSAFAGWYLESNFVTKINTTTVVSKDSNHTLYAKWVAWLEIHVNGTSNSVDARTKLDQEVYDARVIIYPSSNQYVESFSFDNVTFYQVTYTHASISSLNFAVAVNYEATLTSNILSFSINSIYPNYFNETGAIHLYIITTDTAYESLRDSVGGSVSGVAVSATKGGSVTIIGDDFDKLENTDTITVRADLCLPGYRFAGWYLASNMSNCLSTNESERFVKSLIYETQLIAYFEPIEENDNLNGDINN